MKNISKHKHYHIIMSIIFIIATLSFSVYSSEFNQINLNAKEFKQGTIITLKIDKSLPVHQVTFNNQTYKFRNNEDQKIAIIPISYWTNPGQYKLSINTTDDKIIEKSIKITPGDFETSYIEVEQQEEELIRPQKEETIQQKKEDQKLINNARKNSSNKKNWSSNFIWPVEGQISTDFGATRYVNGELQSRHSGIDIATQKGKTVVASNTGTVKLAKNLLVTGNTIIIDHGWNIFSSYSHLSKINVQKGEMIKRGQKIGEIGSTGFSTGPHLHWTITIGKVFINPRIMIENNF